METERDLDWNWWRATQHASYGTVVCTDTDLRYLVLLPGPLHTVHSATDQLLSLCTVPKVRYPRYMDL